MDVLLSNLIGWVSLHTVAGTTNKPKIVVSLVLQSAFKETRQELDCTLVISN